MGLNPRILGDHAQAGLNPGVPGEHAGGGFYPGVLGDHAGRQLKPRHAGLTHRGRYWTRRSPSSTVALQRAVNTSTVHRIEPYCLRGVGGGVVGGVKQAPEADC